MNITNKRQRALLALMRSRPNGVTSGAAAEFIGVEQAVAYWHLRKLRGAGLCGPSSTGGANVVWALTEHLPAIKARIQEQLDAKQRRYDMLERKRRLAEQEAREQEAFLRQSRRVVPANQCAPVRIAGPISVFHQAA